MGVRSRSSPSLTTGAHSYSVAITRAQIWLIRSGPHDASTWFGFGLGFRFGLASGFQGQGQGQGQGHG